MLDLCLLGTGGMMPLPGTEVSGMKVECLTDFGVVALSSLTDEPIRSSDNMLLSTVGRSRNTGSQFDGEKMVDIGKRYRCDGEYSRADGSYDS